MTATVDLKGTGRDLDEALAYGILRLTLGVNIFLHGATRLSAGVAGFVSATVQQFSSTPLPATVYPAGTVTA